MTNKELQQLIFEEFEQKTLGVTEQYLDIHKPVYEEGFPKIVKIDRNDEFTVAYISVKDEHFLLAVYINESVGEIYSIGTLSRNTVSFVATSDDLSAENLSAFTKLNVSKCWNKGDPRFENKIAKHKFNAILIEPNPEPDEFEDKLKNLLHYLLQDKEGIKALSQKSNVYIDAVMDCHYGNQHIDTTYIDIESIGIMNELNLSIRMDIWAWGKPFK